MKKMTFQQYLKSDERRKMFENHPDPTQMPSLEERLKGVHHSDVMNWRELTKK